jgi:diguanylate cyclase (GGDEF)-like protein
MKILLIEDDAIVTQVLTQALTSQHYIVEAAADGLSGWDYAQLTHYDLILLDVGLPKLDGISLCRRLRAQGYATPILLMTAKDAPADRIAGLDAGADDYLIKPLDLGELQARVRALLRRSGSARTPLLESGDLCLDPNTCQVTFAGQPLTLTPKEYSLLELFLRNPLRVFSRGQILEHLWTFDDSPQEDSVKAHIKGLRQKLKTLGAVDWIENVYGIGYRLQPQDKTQPQSPEKALPAVAHSTPVSSAPIALQSGSQSKSQSGSQSIEQEFNLALGGLWQKHQGRIADRLHQLQQAVTALQQQDLSLELRHSACQAAHKLAGVLGMFQRDAGTKLAREVEQILTGERAITAEQQHRLVSRVQELEQLLKLPETPPESTPPSAAARSLLIDADPQLDQELRPLGRSLDMEWERVPTIQHAQRWLQDQIPALVVLSLSEDLLWETASGLLTDLAHRTPPVPVLVLAAGDRLGERVAIARAGGSGFLVKPVTGQRVWEVATQLWQRARSLSVNLLVVDDEPIFLDGLQALLEPWGIRMTKLTDPVQFWEGLQTTAPDLLILDVEMPHINGIELCQAVRIDPDWQGLPILFLTAHRDPETIQQIFAAGADDYVSKPIIGPELLTRIMNRLERSRFLQTFSTRDPITGLTNQLQAQRDLEHQLQVMQRDQQPLSFVVLRIEQFHQIQIQYGHQLGRKILQQWGTCLQTALPQAEIVSYWGDGEFAIALSGLTKSAVREQLDEVLATLRRQVFIAESGQRFQVTYTLGIAEYPLDGQTLSALYQACCQGIC